jgi:hypothetical protein
MHSSAGAASIKSPGSSWLTSKTRMGVVRLVFMVRLSFELVTTEAAVRVLFGMACGHRMESFSQGAAWCGNGRGG